MDRLSAAALRWVPHPRFARSLPRALRALGAVEVHGRADTVLLAAWDPDHPDQSEGPPGLPIRTIAAAAPPEARVALESDLEMLTDHARRGEFHATLTIMSVAARF